MTDFTKTFEFFSDNMTKAKRYREKLNTNKAGTSRLQFPSDLDYEGNHHILRFSFNLPSGSKYLSNGSYRKGIDPVTGQSTSTYRLSDSRSLQRKFSQNYTRTTTYIDLFMPNQIQTAYQSKWDASDLGVIGSLIDAGTSLGDLHDQKNLERIWGVAKTQLGESAISAATGAIQGVTGLKANDAAKMIRQTTPNPYTEVIFNGVSNRTFSFTFKMIPKNKKEQAMIKRIIDEFVFHRAPEVKYQNQNNYMVNPSEVDVKYLWKNSENHWMHKISTCAITDVTVNYSPEGQFMAHADGSPFATELTISLTELENLSKERHRQGY